MLGENIAIIENEYGDINIDSQRIEQTGLEIKSISSGCICCSLSGEFDLAMKELIDEYDPNRIIIEPTGVGKLSDIIEVVNRLKEHKDVELNMIMAIIDVLEFEDFIDIFGGFFTDQIQYANTVILSKAQLTTEDKVDEVLNSIRKINADGNVITTPWDELSGKDILELAESKKQDLLSLDFHNNHDHEDQDEFQYWTMETTKKHDATRLKETLEKLKDNKYGKVLRSKGMLPGLEGNWLSFDYLPNSIEVRDCKVQAVGQIVVIGQELNEEELQKILQG